MTRVSQILLLGTIRDKISGLSRVELKIGISIYDYLVDSFILSKFNYIFNKSPGRGLVFIKKNCINFSKRKGERE